MIDRSHFFNAVRLSLFGGSLSQSQVLGLDTILAEYEKNYSYIGPKQLAYILATAYHEVARTMQPIEEYGKGKKKDYGKFFVDANGKKHGRKMSRKPYYQPLVLFYGRGFVQLTWYENYERASKELGIDFINNPELVLQIENATKIMFKGMIEGWFTGKKLSSYFGDSLEKPISARKIINGSDKALMIANYYYKFLSAIKEMP